MSVSNKIAELSSPFEYGSMVRRSDFEKAGGSSCSFEKGEYKFLIVRDVISFGSYSADQYVKVLGWRIRGRSNIYFYKTSSKTINSLDLAVKAVDSIISESEAMCTHAEKILLKKLGKCLKLYECKYCSKLFEVDSSD